MSDICKNVFITESPIILYKFRMCMIINICKNANIHKIKIRRSISIMEEWKQIKGLPSCYEISSAGNIRIDWVDHYEPVETKDIKTGTVAYILSNTYKVHRLVAEAFLPNPEGKKMVRHKDGNLFNNDVSNLEWVSRAEETKRNITSGKVKGKRIYCKETNQVYLTLSTASACTGVPPCAIEYSMMYNESMYGFTFTDADNISQKDADYIYLSKSDLINRGKIYNSVEEGLRNIDTVHVV